MSQETEILQRQLDSLIAEFEAVRREAAEDGIDDEEQATLDEIQVMIDTTRSALNEAQREDFGAGTEPPVQDVVFEEGLEIEVPDPDVSDTIRFDAMQGAYISHISDWRTHCQGTVDTLVNSMLDPAEDGPEVPRGDLISLASTVLSVAEVDPRVAVAVGTINTLFDLAKNAYQRTLPRQPSVRQAQIQWSDALDEITQQHIENGFPEIVSAFKRANGIPVDDEWLLPSFQADWNALINQIREGAALPSASTVRQQFMTTLLRAMPDSPWDDDLSSGTVGIVLSYDRDSRRFSFDSGAIDDVTDEVLQGLQNNPTIYGPKITDLPLPIEFRIHDASFLSFGNPLLCSIWRRTQTSGDTSFRLDQRPGSSMTLDEQNEVFAQFGSQRAYDIEVRQILR